nr:MFS transporter [Phytoactinopolyspora halophila]
MLLVLERTGDAWLGGFVVAAMTLPHVVTGPLTGHLRDHLGRPVAVTATAITITAAAIATLAAVIGHVPWPVVTVTALLAGAAVPLLLGGLSSMVGGLAPPEHQRAAHALDSATYNVAGVSGPALGAGITAYASAATGVISLAVLAAIGALTCTAIPQPGTRPSASSRGSMLDGFRFLWDVRELRTTTAATTLAHGGLGGLDVIAPLLAVHLGAQESAGGLFLSAFAAGAGVGSLAMALRWAKRVPPIPVVLGSLLLMASGLGLAALATSVPAATALFALAGFADGPLLATTLHVRTTASPPEARTQVFMVGASLKLTFAAAGSAIFGLAAGAGGQSLVLAVAFVVAASALPCVGRHRHPPSRGRDQSVSRPA